MRRIKTVLWFLMTAVVVLASAGATTQAAESRKVRLALNWKAEPQFGGFYAAKAGGAYARRGLDVEILEGGAGTPTIQMVAAGTVEFGVVSGDEVIISRARGGDPVAVYAVYQTNPQGLMAHVERGFRSIADLYAGGGTLALQKGLAYAMYLERKYAGHKVALVPYAGGVATFLNDPNHSQQCFVTSEPLIAEKSGKKVRTFLVADEGYNPYTTVLAVRSRYLGASPEIVKAMVEGTREGWAEYLKNPEPTNQVMAKLNPSMDAATFAASAAAQSPLIEPAPGKGAPLGAMTEARWAELAAQLTELKLIDKAPAAADVFRNH